MSSGRDLIENKVIDWVTDRWHTKWIPAASILFLFVGILLLVPSVQNFVKVSSETCLTLMSLSLLVLVVWGATWKPRRTRKGHIGFVVAILGESDNERKKIRRDFIDELKKTLNQSDYIIPFDVIIVDQHIAKRVIDVESARRCLADCRAHFLIYGDVRTRNECGKVVNAMRLEGLITHANIRQEVSRMLANEMCTVLPLKINIPQRDDLKGFEVASVFFGIASKFIVATAALISGDIVLAQALLNELYKKKLNSQISNSRLLKKQCENLKKLIPMRLADAYFALSRENYSIWRTTRNPERLKAAYEYIEQYKAFHPSDIHYCVTKAIYVFVFERNTQKAISILESIKRPDSYGPNVRYGLAFLHAYCGNLTVAERHYKKAFRLDSNGDEAFEIEEFIIWILESEPEKTQFHYCLGLLNLVVKKDAILSKRDFSQFVSTEKSLKFPEQAKKAREWINAPNIVSAANDELIQADIDDINRPAA